MFSLFHKRSSTLAEQKPGDQTPLRARHPARRGANRGGYLNTLATVSAVERLVRFYVQEHNTRLPHSAFQGQTPDEMYFQTGAEIPERLEAVRNEARRTRAEANRNRECETCELAASRS